MTDRCLFGWLCPSDLILNLLKYKRVRKTHLSTPLHNATHIYIYIELFMVKNDKEEEYKKKSSETSSESFSMMIPMTMLTDPIQMIKFNLLN